MKLILAFLISTVLSFTLFAGEQTSRVIKYNGKITPKDVIEVINLARAENERPL